MKNKSQFTKNVITLMTGTTIAQAIPIAISPILTRFYTPEDFGTLALFISITTILSIIVTGRYELAILLPKDDIDAINILFIALGLSFIMSFILLIIVSIFNIEISNILGNEDISVWLYFIPITVFVIAMYQSLSYYYNRKKKYTEISISRVTQSGTTSVSNIILGYWQYVNIGLIAATIIGQIFSLIILLKVVYKNDNRIFEKIDKLKIKKLFKKYNKFPKFDLLSSVFNILSTQSISILFNIILAPTTAGYYYLVQRTLSLPMAIIASSILDVFKEQASREYQLLGNAKVIYIETFKKLFILSFIITLLIYLYIVQIFTFIFGEQWIIAGEFAKIMSPMFFLQFISSPLSFMLYIGDKLKLNLYSQFILTVFILLSFYMAETSKDVITLITIFSSMFYLMQLYISANIALVFE